MASPKKKNLKSPLDKPGYVSPFLSLKELLNYPERSARHQAIDPADKRAQRALAKRKLKEARSTPAPISLSPKSPEYKRLLAQWDEILRLDGFEDIELGNGALGVRNTPYLPKSTNGAPTNSNTLRRGELASWFDAHRAKAPYTPLERDVAVLTFKGHGYQSISRILRVYQKKILKIQRSLYDRAHKWHNRRQDSDCPELATEPTLQEQILEEFAQAQNMACDGHRKPAPTLEDISKIKSSCPMDSLFDDPMKEKNRKKS